MNQISCRELKILLTENPGLSLVDVREPYEHDAFNIGGDLIPSDEILHHHAIIPLDKPVILYCRKGIRSAIAIQRLEAKFGFTNLINLAGGVSEWR
jgi:adenylyltransferase/sulfurtransferase